MIYVNVDIKLKRYFKLTFIMINMDNLGAVI
jgi:hypothetical protein